MSIKRQIYCKQPDGSMAWVTTDRKRAPRRTSHQVITDEMDPTWAPFNDQVFTSKSKLRRAAKAEGLIEVGNEYIGPRNHYDEGDLGDIIRDFANK